LSEIKEKPHVSKGFKSLSEGSSDIPFESAKKITTVVKNDDSSDCKIEDDKGELDTPRGRKEEEKSRSDQQDDPATAEVASPEAIRRKASYPTVTNTEFPVQKMTPPITRQTKVSFAVPEDSDSSSVSSGVSSLTSPWSSPQPKRPSLSRQKPIETEITVDVSRSEINEEKSKSPRSALKNTEFMGKVEEISSNSPDKDQASKNTSALKVGAPLLIVEGQSVSESESKFSSSSQANLPQSVVCDTILQNSNMISKDQQGAVMENPFESPSAAIQEHILQTSNISPIQETECQEESRNELKPPDISPTSISPIQETEEESRNQQKQPDISPTGISSKQETERKEENENQLKPPNNSPTGLSSASSEGDIVSNMLLKDEDVVHYKPSTADTVKKAASSDCLHSESVEEKGSPKSPTRPFKSSISSSALLLSSLSPVLPRGHTYYSHSLSSLNANSILAGNVPARPIKSTAIQSVYTPYTPLRSLSQSVPNLRDSPKRQTSAPPSFRQSLPETSFLEEEPVNSDSSVMCSSVEGLPRITDIDGEPELNKKSLQIGAKPKEGPSRISTNPSVSRAKSGTKTPMQTSKPTRDSQRPPKGPSGIVMGKAAILPSRTGPRSVTSPRKNGQSQEPKKSAGVTGTSDEPGKKKSSPSRKPPAALATSESHNYSCATCGRRRSSATKINEDIQSLSEKDKTNTDKKLSASGRGSKSTLDEKKSTDSKSKPKLHKDRTPRFV
jgi:hypothetical protein